MNILLLGANGQLGWQLRRALAPLGRLTAWDRGDAGGDLARPDELAQGLRRLRPEVVVNAAAYTAVDRAEQDAVAAQLINASAPQAIAQVLAESGAMLVHYSTDFVFDGSGSAAWAEDAPTVPLNVYGRSKLAGEQAIRASGCRHLILRTSWVHAARGQNFARTMLRLAAERDSLNVVDDQIGAPTGADLLADTTAHALRALAQRPELGGTYHACAAGEVSWCGYARHLLGWARARGVALRASAESVHAIASADYPSAARRPLNSRLDTTRLCRQFGLQMPDWRDSVNRMLAEVLQLPLRAPARPDGLAQ